MSDLIAQMSRGALLGVDPHTWNITLKIMNLTKISIILKHIHIKQGAKSLYLAVRYLIENRYLR